MDGRAGFIFLFVLIVNSACNARELGSIANPLPVQTKVTVFQINPPKSENELHISSGIGKNHLCALCEEYTGEALTYLAENKTQADIITILHKSCSKMLSLKQQCITLVDYYAPLFFLEVSAAQPDDFCRKFGLYEPVLSEKGLVAKDSCELCEQTMAEVLMKLQDPDTQLEVIEVLLKACNSIQQNYVKKSREWFLSTGL